jgi:arsenite methyltransferase
MNSVDESNLKQCCAAFYGSDLARMLLGDTFHPGGTGLTDRLILLTKVNRDCTVLDVAAGRGTSAFHVAQSIGCRVIGVDLSEENVKLASEEALKHGVTDRVTFRVADAEGLPFDSGAFDAILCECAFCTFPNKQTAAAEFSRVLKPGGRLGLSDLTRTAASPRQLDGLLSWIACIGDALPVASYLALLQGANFTIEVAEDHSEALVEFVRQVQGKLLVAEIAVGLKKLDLPNVDLAEAKRFAQAALSAVKDGQLGYVVIGAVKSE